MRDRQNNPVDRIVHADGRVEGCGGTGIMSRYPPIPPTLIDYAPALINQDPKQPHKAEPARRSLRQPPEQ
jgi:hypothetical protein